MEHKKKVGLNAIFLIATLIINALGGFGIINGTSQSDVSDRYFTLITPSGTTFSIWSVIYGLVILSLIVMYVKRDDLYYQKVVDRITPLFILSCILNMLWIILFSFVLVEISTVVIFAFTVVLALICKQLLALHDGKKILLPLTFGLYTSWLLIATVVNIASSLVKMNWNGFGIEDDIWAFIILIVAILIVIGITINTQNAIMPLAVAWAYYGINQNLINEHTGDYGLLQLVTIIGLVVLIGMAAIQFYKNKWGILPRTSVRRSALK